MRKGREKGKEEDLFIFFQHQTSPATPSFLSFSSPPLHQQQLKNQKMGNPFPTDSASSSPSADELATGLEQYATDHIAAFNKLGNFKVSDVDEQDPQSLMERALRPVIDENGVNRGRIGSGRKILHNRAEIEALLKSSNGVAICFCQYKSENGMPLKFLANPGTYNTVEATGHKTFEISTFRNNYKAFDGEFLDSCVVTCTCRSFNRRNPHLPKHDDSYSSTIILMGPDDRSEEEFAKTHSS